MVKYIKYTPELSNNWSRAWSETQKQRPWQTRRLLDSATASQVQSKIWLINELQKDGLDKKKFNKTIENLKYSNKVIDYYVRENLEKNSYFSAKKNQLILNKDFFHNPQEVIFRSFSDVIQMVGKKYYPVRGKKIDKIINDLENGRILKVTIGGCIVEKVNETLIISKEH